MHFAVFGYIDIRRPPPKDGTRKLLLIKQFGGRTTYLISSERYEPTDSLRLSFFF